MEKVTIKDGYWFYTGRGSEGLKEYKMGPATEVTRNFAGYETGYTVAEAYKRGLLEVDPETGNPICNVMALNR